MNHNPNMRNNPGIGRYGHFGIYRGFIVDVDDPESLGRVRVRVNGIVPQSIPASGIPWAEMGAMFGGKFFGNIQHWAVGDGVWTMFEGGDIGLPVVIGGWLSASLGINDLPADINAANGAGVGKWMLIDRKGNVIELSENVAEQWIRMASGSAEVKVSQIDGSVSITAKSGVVRTTAGGEYHIVKMYSCNGEQILMQATGLDELGGVAGIMDLFANLELNLHSSGDVDTNGTIHIGGYTPTLMGVKPTDPVTAAATGQSPRQTKILQVISRIAQIGSAPGDVDGVPRPETEQVIVNGVTVVIKARAATTLPSLLTPLVDIEVIGGNATVTATGGDIDVTATKTTTGGNINVSATGGKVTATSDTEIDATVGTASVKVKPSEIDATVGATTVKLDSTSVEAAASDHIQATVGNSQVKLDATSVTAKATGNVTAQVTGGAHPSEVAITNSDVTIEAGGTTMLVNSAGVTIT